MNKNFANDVITDVMTIDCIADKLDVVAGDLIDNFFENDALISTLPQDACTRSMFWQAMMRVHIMNDYIGELKRTVEGIQTMDTTSE